MGKNTMREFIKLEFEGLLMPLYIKTSTDSVCFCLEARYIESQRMYLKFKTGRFPYNNELPYFKVLSIEKNKYGRSVVEIVTAERALKSFRFVEMDEESDEIVWSRRYYSETFGFSYDDDAKEFTPQEGEAALAELKRRMEEVE